jgi:hypothetical protein
LRKVKIQKRAKGPEEKREIRGFKLQYLELNTGLRHSSERCGLPVCLLCLLPHDYIEAGAVLVTKDEACIVIICLGIYMEGPFEVDSIESCVPCQDQMSLEKQVTLAAGRSLQEPQPRPRTYPLPSQDHCSWSAQSPCPGKRDVELRTILKQPSTLRSPEPQA